MSGKSRRHNIVGAMDGPRASTGLSPHIMARSGSARAAWHARSSPPPTTRLSGGWALLDVLLSGAVALLLSAAAALAYLHVWQTQTLQEQVWEAHWAIQRWAQQIGRQWQQTGSLALRGIGQGEVVWVDSVDPSAGPQTAYGAPQLNMVYSLPEGLSHAGCLDFLAATLGDQVSDALTLRSGSIRCTSKGVTQPMLSDVHSWQLSWATRVGTDWQWQSSPPAAGAAVQALEICLIQSHPAWPAETEVAPVDCAGNALPTSTGQYLLNRYVFHAPVMAPRGVSP